MKPNDFDHDDLFIVKEGRLKGSLVSVKRSGNKLTFYPFVSKTSYGLPEKEQKLAFWDCECEKLLRVKDIPEEHWNDHQHKYRVLWAEEGSSLYNIFQNAVTKPQRDITGWFQNGFQTRFRVEMDRFEATAHFGKYLTAPEWNAIVQYVGTGEVSNG